MLLNDPLPVVVKVIVPEGVVAPASGSVTVAVQVVPSFAVTGETQVTDVVVGRVTTKPKAPVLVE